MADKPIYQKCLFYQKFKSAFGTSMGIPIFIAEKKRKIFRAVIIFNAIFMMDILKGFKMATQNFLHNQSMFSYITRFCSRRMIRFINLNISISIFKPSAFPVRIRMLIFTSNTHFSSPFLRKLFPFTSNTQFFSCFFSENLKKPPLFNLSFSFFGMMKAFCSRHFITSKITALFRYLREQRLSYSTLLSADFRHRKTVSLLDDLSITKNLILSI